MQAKKKTKQKQPSCSIHAAFRADNMMEKKEKTYQGCYNILLNGF